jgi:methyl-accepting chemotaxis protein
VVDLVANQALITVGVIGGGRGGMQLFGFFDSSRLAKIRFVVDTNVSAPAVMAARAKQIPTYTDFEQALEKEKVDFVIETTGIQGFDERLAERLAGTHTGILTHGVARLMIQVMAEHRQHTQAEVSDVVHPIKDRLASGLQGSQAIVKEINQVMASMQMLALNASIEAAKAGVHGRGFAVVANQMGKSVETVRTLTQEIESVNANIIQVSTQIDSILEMLQ